MKAHAHQKASVGRGRGGASAGGADDVDEGGAGGVGGVDGAGGRTFGAAAAAGGCNHAATAAPWLNVSRSPTNQRQSGRRRPSETSPATAA